MNLQSSNIASMSLNLEKIKREIQGNYLEDE